MTYRKYWTITKTPGRKPYKLSGPHAGSPWMEVTGRFATLKEAKAAVDRHLLTY